MRTVLIAGASGVVGHAALDHFLRLGDWEVIALSRRSPAPAVECPYRHLRLDLQDSKVCMEAAHVLGPVTHLIYSALYEKPGLVRGWRERDQMDTNLAMLRNLMQALCASGARLEHVSLLQGTKAYGVHLHPLAVPARERWPRDPHDNFYWLQEDYLRQVALQRDFALTIFRPQVIFGDVIGVPMNIMPVLGTYAAICRHEGWPFSFPGGPDYVLEGVDARLMAQALAWAATAPAARDQTFNITNGDVFVWRNVWPAIAAAFGCDAGPDEPRSMAEWLADKAAVWEHIVVRHGLRPIPLEILLGESPFYADFCFAYGACNPPPPVIVSTIKLRHAGFAACIDTEEMFRELAQVLIERRLLPPR